MVKQLASNLYILVQVQLSPVNYLEPFNSRFLERFLEKDNPLWNSGFLRMQKKGEMDVEQIYKYRSQYGTYYQVFKVSVKDV